MLDSKPVACLCSGYSYHMQILTIPNILVILIFFNKNEL